MAISNKFGNMLLSTSNKSESAVGYSTLYGDMSGGFSPLKDVWKTDVFALSKWRNLNIPSISKYNKRDVIPDTIINKPPTAELRENQKDTDSLPDYKTLDAILALSIEEMKGERDIIKSGFDEKVVKKVLSLLRNSEYKRFQAPPGPKLGKKAFGRDRMYPLTNKF
jgi:NAD+ synthase